MAEIDVSRIWLDYENARNYKSSENLYNIVRRNERYYAGDQWKGVKSKDLNTLTYNFIEQLVDVKVSSIMSNPITITRKADDIDAENSNVAQLAKAMTLMDKKNWERLKMEMLNEEMLLKCAVSGLGGTYWYWDNDITTGNEFKTKGDFKAETYDTVDLYVANPNCNELQSQDWIILTTRKTVKQVKDMARKNGLSDDEIAMITGDEDTSYTAYDKANFEQDNQDSTNNVTVILRMWKQDGEVWFSKSTESVMIKKPETTELTRYPVAKMNWKKRQKFIYGTAEPTYIIGNQQAANKQASIRDLSAKLTGTPSILYNKNLISGVTNQAGRTYGVDVPLGTPLTSVIQYIQPQASSIDIDKSLETNINLTKELKGINDNVIGASRPENTSAIIAQQRAAGVPLEIIKRAFWQYIEDVALIWKDFYENKYDMTRKLIDDDGKKIDFVGTNAKDAYLKTKIDVGESLQVTEITTLNQLDQWLQAGFITFKQYLEMFPKNLVPGSEKLLIEISGPLESEEQQGTTQIPPEVVELIMSQPNGEQLIAELQAMPPEEQQAAIEQLTGGVA